jgi:CheY-like chemotaxis protein
VRILVIDSDPQTAGVVDGTLGREHEIVSTTSGFAAIERIAIGRAFDVILCDLDMPDLSGKEIHRRLLESAPQTAAKIVFLVSEPKAQKTFLEGVKNLFLARPVAPVALRETVRALSLR